MVSERVPDRLNVNFQTAGDDSQLFVELWLISSLLVGVCGPSLSLYGSLRSRVSHDTHTKTHTNGHTKKILAL